MLVAAAVAMAVTAPARAASLTGRVVDREGRPIEFANVAAPTVQRGAVTDSGGRFTLELPDGPVAIQVSQLGYQLAELTVTVGGGGAPIVVTLVEEPVPVAEVEVRASSFGKVGKSEGATLRRMDVLTTPGGAADVFQSLRALPSINAPNEGAAVYVRGGDPSETLIRLDNGEMGHPYHYEGASGGLFSSFDTYMLKSAFFSSGGFSAKYGGVLSGVLDIETQDPWNLHTVSLGANFAGAGMSTSWALVPDKLSFIGSARFSRIDLLQKLYGTVRDYVALPHSADGAAKLLYRYSSTGRLSALYLGAGDGVDVIARRYNYAGSYQANAQTNLGAIQWQDTWGEHLALHGHVGYQNYRNGSLYGVMDQTQREHNATANLDAVWDASERHQVAFGANVQRLESEWSGQFPSDSTDLGPGAPNHYESGQPVETSPGVYAEDKVRLWGPVYATLGGRADYASGSDTWTVDPRGALAWRIDDHQTVRVAGGRYHQLPPALDLDDVYGNPTLGPLAADHVIAGYEWKTPDHNVRIEAYRKRYTDLITTSPKTYYANEGHGYAQGVDFFAQVSNRQLSGWISYGYMDSRRMEQDDPRELPSAYGVAHSATLVATYAWRPTIHFGGRYSVSSGRPYTPILGGAYDSTAARWQPIQAENRSGLMPFYQRLDLRVTQLFSLPAGGGLPASSVCVLYVEVLNALDIRNVLDYSYNEDYSQRTEVDSYFGKRMAVAGVAMTW
jgi:hypothetical protein